MPPFLAFHGFAPPTPEVSRQGSLSYENTEQTYSEWQCEHCGTWGDTLKSAKAQFSHWLRCQRRLVDRQRHQQFLRTGRKYPLRLEGAK